MLYFLNMAKRTPSLPPPLTDNELGYLKTKADRVLFLLDISAMPDEVKTSWLTLLPEMTLDQVDRLATLLEEEILLAAAYSKQHPEDEELLLKLKLAKEHYDTQTAVADKKMFLALAQIETALPQ